MQHSHKRTDLPGLEAFALNQGGYFDQRDAGQHGLGKDLIHYHVQTGRFKRVERGVYRLRNAPSAPHDELLRAWVWSNYRGVAPHESALELYGLSDVLAGRVQLTVPLSFARTSPGYLLHRAKLDEGEIAEYEGLPATAPARTIVDAAATGTGPEQIELAVRQAIARGLATTEQLRIAAARPRYRNRRLTLPMIEGFLRHAAA